MQENLMGWLGPLVMGMIIGFVYSRNGILSLEIGKTVLLITLALLGFLCLSLWLIQWKNGVAGSILGLGICLSVFLRLKWLHQQLPYSLKYHKLNARFGEEYPTLGAGGGLWVLSYSNGQSMCYNKRGDLQRICFPDGSQWDL